MFLQRHGTKRESAVRRIDLGIIAHEPGGQRIERRLRIAQRPAGTKLRQDVVVLAGPNGRGVALERQIEQDLGVFDDAQSRQHFTRDVESCRQHTNDFVWHVVHPYRTAHDRGLSAITPLPRAVGQHGDSGRALTIVRLAEQATRYRLRAKHRQQI